MPFGLAVASWLKNQVLWYGVPLLRIHSISALALSELLVRISSIANCSSLTERKDRLAEIRLVDRDINLSYQKSPNRIGAAHDLFMDTCIPSVKHVIQMAVPFSNTLGL